MAALITQTLMPSELLAVFGAAKNAFGKYFERKDTADDNRDQLERLLIAYNHIKKTTEKLIQSLSTFDYASQGLIRIHAGTVTRNESALQSLKEDVRVAKRTDRVNRMNQTLKEYENDLEKIMEFLSKEVVPVLTECQKHSPNSVYVRDDNVPPNPPRLTLDYTTTVTSEGKLKAALLQEGRHRIVGVVAVGMGGVGKTCALRGLAADHDIYDRFPGGVLYIQLGNDATPSTLITGIATLVQRTGNASLAAKLKAFDGLQEAVDAASVWFRNQTCLLLIDDVWLINGITSSMLGILATMLSVDSRLVYTTRTEALKNACGQVIQFSPLETCSDSARKMLMKHAEFDWDGALSKSNEEAVRGLLQVCNGLPVAIGIVGATVRNESKPHRAAENAWSDVYDRIRCKKNSIADDDQQLYGYGGVGLVVDTSLDVLRSTSKDTPYDKMFRALCVLLKQQRVPLHMLKNLWGLPSMVTTDKVVSSLHEVNLVLRVTDNGKKFLQLHDVILDIASRQASEQQEEQQFWQTLIDRYMGYDTPVSDAPLRQSSEDLVASRRSKKSAVMQWMRKTMCCHRDEAVGSQSEQTEAVDVVKGKWEWWSTANDGYIHDNVCRALRGAGYEQQLLWQLSQPEWIVKRLQNSGISAVERDLEVGKKVAAVHNGGDDAVVKHLEMVRKAARLGCARVLENKSEAWFQIHGRLLGYATQCARTQRFVEDMEMRAPRPWAKASLGFLQQASTTALDIFSVSGTVYSVQMDDERVVCCWVGGTTVGVTQYTFASGLSETREQDCEDITPDMHAYLYQNCVTLSPDLKTVVIGLADGCIWTWDTENDRTKRSRERHDDSAVCVAVSEDGELIASGSWDHSVRVWNAESAGVVGHALVGHTAAVECVAWSANGRRVASGSRDGTVRLWDVQRGEGVGQPLVGHTHFVKCVAWSADGKLLASGSNDKSVRLWNVESGQQVRAALVGHSDYVLCVSWSADGRRLASGSRDFTARVWDASSGQLLGQPLVGHASDVYCLAWNANGRSIVSGSPDGTARVWEGYGGEVAGQPQVGHTASVHCVALSGDKTRALTGSADCTVRMWDVRSATALGRPFVGHNALVHCVAWSSDEKRAVSGAADGSVRVWDVESGRAVGAPLVGHTSLVRCVAWSRDGKRVASGSHDQTVRLWDVDSAQAAAPPLTGHTNEVLCVAWSADGTHVASGSADNTLRVWKAHGEARMRHALSGHTNRVDCVAWSWDGRFVVSGSRDRSVRVWNVESGQTVGRALEHDFGIVEVGVNEDGSQVVSHEWRSGARSVWSVADGECVASGGDATWGATLRALQQQRLSTARRSFWNSGSTAVTQRRADGSDAFLGTCDTPVERFGELWYSAGRFAHCEVIGESK